jgi:O-antigen/teichoic acid export membrane protein
MIKKIAGTAGTRILNALFTLVILWLFTNYVGSKGLGIIGLVILDITIIQLFYDLLSGNPLVYFASRTQLIKLIIPAYVWIIIVSLAVPALFILIACFFPGLANAVVPSGFGTHIIILATVNGFTQVHYNILIGQGKIKVYNILFTLQILLTLTVFSFLVFDGGTVNDYITAMYAGWGFVSLISMIIVLRKMEITSLKGWIVESKKVIRFGMIGFAANIFHIGNKRFAFYFIKAFSGLSPLGVYNAGAQLTEGVRIIGQSISLVQYSAISGSRSGTYARNLTISLMKVSVFLTIFALLILILIPSGIYELVLSKNFAQVKTIIVFLSPGVLALSANTVFSHYFSGMGRPSVNLISNIYGFAVTIVFALLLIPDFGIYGAALTASLSYITSVVYQFYIFKNETGTKLREWKITVADFRNLRLLISKHNKKSGGDE